ncbi:hypothetical protein H5407_04935 [Mitsuaria sp. WAJ17]|uniref:hypothetical protein n=1 Tax=Mitsuaria sp. WAJ17 TaxID=2761452 RepID=UPI001603DCA5|nr:hypothetical protein [Mitsuaria sp. WAJ17]MBB2484566.1 hypothetical protein [Mitsuaria sp. WAJ17]
MDTQLNFINRSLAGHTAEIVLFQKNLALDMSALDVAWKVIRYCGRDCSHPVVFSQNFEVSVQDRWGNFTPRLAAEPGRSFELVRGPVGGRLLRHCRREAAATHAANGVIEVLNAQSQGAVDVCLYRGGVLLGCKTSVVPGQKAVFRYPPSLWIAVASEITAGQAFQSAVLSEQAVELSLMGVARADLVMTGGGAGPAAGPYEFSLENVVAW